MPRRPPEIPEHRNDALANLIRGGTSALLGLVFLSVSGTHAADLPHCRAGNGAAQLLVHGKPYLIRGGELGNSSAGAPAQADAILPAMARLQLNTVLVPVAWEQVEPQVGSARRICVRGVVIACLVHRRASDKRRKHAADRVSTGPAHPETTHTTTIRNRQSTGSKVNATASRFFGLEPD